MSEIKQRLQDIIDRDRTHECAGFRSVRVMTNNPNKVEQLKGYGVTVAGRIPHVLPPNEHNRFYLETKAKRSGHFINFGADVVLSEQADTGILPNSVE